jgi:hypothetical protein
MFFPGDRKLALEIVVQRNVCLSKDSRVSGPRAEHKRKFRVESTPTGPGYHVCGRGRLDAKDGGLGSRADSSVGLRAKMQRLRHSIRGTIRHCSKRIEIVAMCATCPSVAKRILYM